MAMAVLSSLHTFWNARRRYMHPIDPLPEVVAQLAQETYSTDLLQLLVANIHRFDFEARKDVAQIFNNLLRRQIGSRWPTVEYLTNKSDVIFTTLKGCVIIPLIGADY